MRLFHVSEEGDIARFVPRTPARNDLDQSTPLVWAIDEYRLANYLTPRNCPRVTYHIGRHTRESDIAAYFSSKNATHVVAIESKWFDAMSKACLYLYEFDAGGFELQDEAAGYYVAKTEQNPIARHRIDNLFGALFARNVEVRIMDHLWDLADAIQSATLNWSFCRMDYAQPRP